MGTEIAVSFNSLRTQLENERSSLYKLDENIKKIVQTSGRFSNDRFNQPSHYTRGSPQMSGGRNSFFDYKNNKTDDQFGKRKSETKTVFSRLSAKTQDSDGEDDFPGIKRAKVPSAVCRELPTRAAVLRAQGDDEQARKRNRRIFGSLLGTLQKFKQEEIVLQTKEEKKAQVERKVEEQVRLEKESALKARKSMFAERESKKATIKALEAKMGRVIEFERWEASQRNLANFILTKTNPHIYWLPKKMTDKASEKLCSSRKYHEKCMIKKRLELQDELYRIEQRCMRPRGPAAKENDPENTHGEKEKTDANDVTVKHEEDKSSKRNKFAMDVDDRDGEDSDGDDRNDEANIEDEFQEESVKEEGSEIVTKTDQEEEPLEVKEVQENLDGLEESTNKENHDDETIDGYNKTNDPDKTDDPDKTNDPDKINDPDKTNDPDNKDNEIKDLDIEINGSTKCEEHS